MAERTLKPMCVVARNAGGQELARFASAQVREVLAVAERWVKAGKPDWYNTWHIDYTMTKLEIYTINGDLWQVWTITAQ